MSGAAPGPSGRTGTFGSDAGPAGAVSPILVDDDDSGAEGSSSACPIVIPDTWNGTTIMLPAMGDQPPRSTSPIIIPESWMGRRLVLPARPRHRRRRAATTAGSHRSESAPQTGGAAAQRSQAGPAPQGSTAAAAAPGPDDTLQRGRPIRGGAGRGGRRGRGVRTVTVGAAAPGRGRGRGSRGGRGAAATAVAPGLDRTLLNKVESLVAGITAGTAALRRGKVAAPIRQDPTAGPSGIHSNRVEGSGETNAKAGLKSGVDTKAGLKSEMGSKAGFKSEVDSMAVPKKEVDTKAGLKKSPPGGKQSAACRPASPVAGPSRVADPTPSGGAGCSAGRSDFGPTGTSDGDGDVSFGVLACTAVGLQYYPGQLTGGGEPVRLLLSMTGPAGTRRDVRVVNGRGVTCGHLSRSFAGVLAPHLEAGRIRLEGVCVDQDRCTAALEVTVRGREQHRRHVCNQLQAMGFELEEPTSQSSPPADLFCPVKPGRSASPDRTLVTPRDPQQAVSERWAEVQRSLKEVEPCAAVASRLYPHQKQALGWMMAREATGSVAGGTDGVCGGILADDMGLGKTLQVIALILTHFKAARPLAVPVPWRKRAPPAALALPSVPKPKMKMTPLQRFSPKIDWSNFKTRLREECQKTPSVETEGDFESCTLDEEETTNVGQRRTRTRKKPVRYIDSSDEEEGEQVDLKRVKPEPMDTPSSSSSEGPSIEPTAKPTFTTIVLDSDEDLLSEKDDSTAPGSGGGAVQVQTSAAGPSGSGSSTTSSSKTVSEYIPVPPSYCDHDGRSSWPGPRTTLIVCPLSVLDNWETQLEQHVHRNVHLRVRSFHGPRRSEDDLVDADVVLTTYATLGRELDRGDDSPLMRNHFLRVVLDEGHTIRNPRSFMARAAYQLRAERRWVLTGTPVQNRLKDLWSLLRFLRLEPYASQRSIWRVKIEQPVTRGSPQAIDRLQTLMAALALRRLKEQEVDGKPIVELPPRNVYIQHVTMEGEQRRRYDTMEEECRRGVARFIRDGTIVRRQVQIMVMLLRLRQLCCHSQLVPEHEQPLPAEEGEEGGAPAGTGDELGPEERRRLVEALTEMLSSGSDEECPVCFEPLRQPVITVCSHVFCRPCVGRLLAPEPGPPRLGAAGGGDGPQCPLCRGPLRAGQLVEVPEEEQKTDEAEKDTAVDLPEDEIISAKVTSLMEGLRAMRAEDVTTKALVVSQFTKLLDRLEAPLREAGMTFCRLDGTMSLAQRRVAMARLSDTEPGAPCVLLLSMRAGGEGINLTAASRVFLLDPSWNPASEEQCFDRCHRLGQTRPVTIVKLVARDSVEERMMQLQDKKRQLMTNAFGGMGLTAEQRRVQFINDMRTLFNL